MGMSVPKGEQAVLWQLEDIKTDFSDKSRTWWISSDALRAAVVPAPAPRAETVAPATSSFVVDDHGDDTALDAAVLAMAPAARADVDVRETRAHDWHRTIVQAQGRHRLRPVGVVESHPAQACASRAPLSTVDGQLEPGGGAIFTKESGIDQAVMLHVLSALTPSRRYDRPEHLGSARRDDMLGAGDLRNAGAGRCRGIGGSSAIFGCNHSLLGICSTPE